MNTHVKVLIFLAFSLSATSCISKKKLAEIQASHQSSLDVANKQLGECGESLNDYMDRLRACDQEKLLAQAEIDKMKALLSEKESQVADLKSSRDQQATQVGDLTVLTQSANDNIKETLAQLEGKDKYINVLQNAKSKADSINLALAVNLKSVLRDGIADEDINIEVDKTVVFINISDKMLFSSGSSNLTPKANDVLGKIAKIVQSKPDFEVMVEGYTDNVPMRSSCIQDNWDLSVKRATSVVRALHKGHGVDPNRLIAAGRGEYNNLADNNTAEGRSTNRRTRIIILPKLNQFYDLLGPTGLDD